jgi:hypothetical protein
VRYVITAPLSGVSRTTSDGGCARARHRSGCATHSSRATCRAPTPAASCKGVQQLRLPDRWPATLAGLDWTGLAGMVLSRTGGITHLQIEQHRLRTVPTAVPLEALLTTVLYRRFVLDWTIHHGAAHCTHQTRALFLFDLRHTCPFKSPCCAWKSVREILPFSHLTLFPPPPRVLAAIALVCHWEVGNGRRKSCAAPHTQKLEWLRPATEPGRLLHQVVVSVCRDDRLPMIHPMPGRAACLGPPLLEF